MNASRMTVASLFRPYTFLLLLTILSANAAVAQWSDATVGPIGTTAPSRGLSWADYDGDGDLDLYVSNNGANLLLRNDGEDLGQPGQWIFTDVAAALGVEDSQRGSMGAWGDFDNDGDLDLYIANDVGSNILMRNDPLDPFNPLDTDRVFVDVTGGDLGSSLSTQSVSWIDFDLDGDVDLYLANRTANELLRNDGEDPSNPGSWIFTDVGAATGTASTRNSQSCTWGDFDFDGDPDLYLVNYGTANMLLRNDPVDPGNPFDTERVFTDIAPALSIGDTGNGRGAAWGDYDNDGDLDIYLTNYGSGNRLFRNEPLDPFDPFDTDRVFTAIGSAAGVADTGNGRGLSWIDFDNDGDLDLYLVNYDDGVNTADNVLWRNDGVDVGNPDGWLFTDVTDALLADDGGQGATAAWGDFDLDGDLDAALANWDAAHSNRLFRNDQATGNHWLHVSLRGHASNSFALGARVRIVAGGASIARELHGGEGYLSQNSHMLEFGLGAATFVDTLEIRWPSGLVQTVTGLAVDQWTQFNEPGPARPTMDPEPLYTAGTVNIVSWSDESLSGSVAYFMQAASDLEFSTVVDTSGWVSATADTISGLSDGQTLFYRVRARDLDGYASNWSAAVKSTQDDGLPVSNALQIESPRGAVPFLMPFLASDGGSGVEHVDLYYGFDDSLTYSYYGTSTDSSPLLFDVSEGPGTYYFYTIAADFLSNLEPAPLTYDVKVEVLPLEWIDVAPSDGTGIANNGNGRGAAWGDYDGDGDHDLFITNRPVWQTGADATNHLFRNDGQDLGNPDAWLFPDVTPASMSNGQYSQGLAWGDYDGDGDLDLYQADMQVGSSPAPNHLYRNDGGGDFVDVAPSLGVDDSGSGRSVAWVDYDSDGDLDLYLCNDGPNHLWRNDGESPVTPGLWVFTDVAPIDGTSVGDDRYTMGCAWADFDADGDQDVYLTNHDGAQNALLRNDGGDVFTDVATTWGVAHPGFGMGCAWADYDGDGLLDLYVSNLGANVLYRRVPETSTFQNATTLSGVSLNDGQYGAGIAWADYDNDGDLDLYLGNHWPESPSPAAPNRLFRNDGPHPTNIGQTLFTDVAPAGGYNIADDASTNGVTFVDYDGDGDLDLYLANMTGVSNRLFRNDTAEAAANHWLQIDLAARAANTTAIGAKLRLVAGGMLMRRAVDGGSGFISQASQTVHFGLGAATVVDTLEIRWPGGYVQTLTALGADQRLTINEPGPDVPTMVAEPSYTPGDSNELFWSNESASGAVAYRVELAADVTFTTILDTSGWITTTHHIFPGLTNEFEGWYRVRARDLEGLISTWSSPVTSIQDMEMPSSEVLPVVINFQGVPFDVSFAAADTVSGVSDVDLYYAYEGGAVVLYAGAAGDSTVIFEFPEGYGEYSFYTVATDKAGNVEDAPLTPDQTVIITAPLWVNIAPTDGSGIGNDGNTRGMSWADYDGDGDHDQFITNRVVWSSPGESINRLFRNDGPDGGDPDSWLFADVTTPPLNNDAYGQGVAWGDFDGDGDLDLYTSNLQANESYPAPNCLYRNDGGGVFIDIAPAAGVDDGDSGRSVSWIDFDQDGDLDLYLCNDGPNHLWRNDGPDGGNPDGWLFTDVAPVNGNDVGDDGYTMGCAWGDYDNDGDPDLYLSNYYGGTNRLLRNDGPSLVGGYWTFTDVAAAMGVADTGSGLGCSWGDFDGDGWLDLYVSNDGPNRLYHNTVSGVAPQSNGDVPAEGSLPSDKRLGLTQLFVDVAGFYDNGLADGQYGAGIAWGDYDNDGDLDFYLGNHWSAGDTVAVNQLFRNDGVDLENPDGWLFTNVAPTNGFNLGDDANTNGVAWVDVDDDGDLDLALASMSGGQNKLFRNDEADASGNHWLQLDLIGSDQNTAAIGARVVIKAGGMTLLRDVDGGSGFLSQGSLTLEFGLGAATVADSVFVRWPLGYYQILTDVAVDQRFSIIQTATGVDDPWQGLVPLAFRLDRNYPNPFNPATVINFVLPRQQSASLRIYAVDGSLVRTLVDGVLPSGAHAVTWRGRDQRGERVGSGVYFYRLVTDEKTATHKMLLLK